MAARRRRHRTRPTASIDWRPACPSPAKRPTPPPPPGRGSIHGAIHRPATSGNDRATKTTLRTAARVLLPAYPRLMRLEYYTTAGNGRATETALCSVYCCSRMHVLKRLNSEHRIEAGRLPEPNSQSPQAIESDVPAANGTTWPPSFAAKLCRRLYADAVTSMSNISAYTRSGTPATSEFHHCRVGSNCSWLPLCTLYTVYTIQYTAGGQMRAATSTVKSWRHSVIRSTSQAIGHIGPTMYAVDVTLLVTFRHQCP